MRLFEKLFPTDEEPIAAERVLDVPSGRNVRELGGYDTSRGPTVFHRFLRSGSTGCLNRRDIERLRTYGVTHVLDLRGSLESPEQTCAFARQRGITWRNVELYECDISDPRLATKGRPDNWLIGSYLTMLANHGAIRQVVTFCAGVPHDSCLLFHCAAGMDRTGVTAMLLLGLAGVDREHIVKDYAYSFGTVAEVDRAVETGRYEDRNPWMSLSERIEAIGIVYDTLVGAYGSVGAYLLDCGVAEEALAQLASRLLEA